MSYANPKFDQVIQQAHGELDDTKRLPLVDQADRMLWDDLPMVPLYQWPWLVAERSTFANIGANPAAGEFWNVEQWARKAS
jgi:peptide/nickel transport system substrate-binding protein